MAGVELSEFRKQRPRFWQCGKNFLNHAVEMDEGNAFGFLPKESNGVRIPINVFRTKICHVALRSAKVPKQFIERASFRIEFGADDALVFGSRDGALLTEANCRPLTFRNNRPGNPAHVHGEVVHATQEHIRGNRAGAHRLQQMFGPCFEQRQMAHLVERFILNRPVPADERRGNSMVRPKWRRHPSFGHTRKR